MSRAEGIIYFQLVKKWRGWKTLGNVPLKKIGLEGVKNSPWYYLYLRVWFFFLGSPEELRLSSQCFKCLPFSLRPSYSNLHINALRSILLPLLQVPSRILSLHSSSFMEYIVQLFKRKNLQIWKTVKMLRFLYNPSPVETLIIKPGF